VIRRREVITLVGGAAAWPLAARAQQPERTRLIGVLMGGAETDFESPPRMKAFEETLARLGWTVGRNLRIEYRWTRADSERTRTGTLELLRMAPDVLIGDGGARTIALLQASRTVPIVFVLVGDPVALGLVQSYSRPGGNATGFTAHEPTVGPKFLQLLKEMVPQLKRIAIMFNPATSSASPFLRSMAHAIGAAAPQFAVEVIPGQVEDPSAIELLLTRLGGEPGAGVVVPPDNYTTVHRKLILDLMVQHRLPAIYAYRYFVADGGLICYGVDAIDPFRQAARYVDRILKGEKPADLPVQAPTKYELVINMKTAKALGLPVPDKLLATADEVIE
jgi:putative tryptophan/tyrosine transport system substrate-binding protein